MIQVRPAASSEDYTWLIELAVGSVQFGVPSSRPASQVEERARHSLADLEATCSDGSVVALIAWEGERRVGYLILQLEERDHFTGTAQSFIYDLAVERDRWGAQVVHRLVEQAARETARRGHRFLVGEVTFDNQRTLVQARRLGFVVERVRLGIGCGPQGRIPLQRRADTAYAASRQKKTRPICEPGGDGRGERI